MSEAYILLNVNYKDQSRIIEEAKKVPFVKTVKSVYGIYDIIIILESDNLQELKNAIDVNISSIQGITNLTTIISVS
ncbi:MAG TPA: Lrp/AsnC ligand binding domain-containing protein [Nitrososphaeraceae archaeon]|nr:Lrp/AsnC ligand binding domain-containing protein [Nitrososphaeraceae archaeon]